MIWLEDKRCQTKVALDVYLSYFALTSSRPSPGTHLGSEERTD
jgi:hypothetical protein